MLVHDRSEHHGWDGRDNARTTQAEWFHQRANGSTIAYVWLTCAAQVRRGLAGGEIHVGFQTLRWRCKRLALVASRTRMRRS